MVPGLLTACAAANRYFQRGAALAPKPISCPRQPAATESVYSYPGIGRPLLSAITNRDLKLVQATALLIVIIYVVTNFIATSSMRC